MVAENSNAHRQKVTTFLTLGHCKTVFHKIQKDERKGHILLPFFIVVIIIIFFSCEIHPESKGSLTKEKEVTYNKEEKENILLLHAAPIIFIMLEFRH